MLILALDTSTTSGSIALVEDGRLLAEVNAPKVKAHARWLMPAIDKLFSSIEETIEDVDLFAIGIGPGSFTGLRIGVSTVKGLAWSLGKPVVGVSTLKALAMNITSPGELVCPVLDARKKELYAALYMASGEDGETVELMSDRAISPASLYEDILEGYSDKTVFFLGTGLERYRADIEDNLHNADFAAQDDWCVRAVNIARLATIKGVEKKDAKDIVPLYKRRSEAEIKGA